MNSIQRRRERLKAKSQIREHHIEITETTKTNHVIMDVSPTIESVKQNPAIIDSIPTEKKVSFDDNKQTIFIDSPRPEIEEKKENIVHQEKMSENKIIPPPMPTSPPPAVVIEKHDIKFEEEDDGSSSLDIDGKELLRIIGQELKIKAAAGKSNIGEDIFIALLPVMMEFIETRKLPGPQKKRIIINVVNVAISKSPFIPDDKRAQMLAWSKITLSGMIDLAVSASKGQLNLNAAVKTGFSLMACCK